MNPLFDRPLDRKGTCSMKYDDPGFFRAMNPQIRLDEDSIRLMLADMDFPCPDAVTKALHRAADFGNFGYVTPSARPGFKEAIISWNSRRYGYSPSPEEIVYTGSAIGAVDQAIVAFSEPGDNILLCYPGYSFFAKSVNKLGRTIAPCHFVAHDDGSYSMDWERFEALCADPKTKAYILCSPHNPLGIVWEREDLARMAAICKAHDVLLISDEIHSDFVRAGKKHTPILSVVEDPAKVILVNGANKSFNLMGLHCAYSLIPDAETRAIFSKNYSVSPTAFTLEAMIAAYNDSEPWLNDLNQYLDESLAFAVDYIRSHWPKARVLLPEGTYILWVDLRGYGLEQSELMGRINRQANVCVSSGSSCDPEQGDGFIRICAACPKQTLEEALSRITAVLA